MKAEPSITEPVEPGKTGKAWKEIRMDYQLYLMLLPALAVLIVFKYFPIYGALIAFKDYNLVEGIFGSKWAGLKHFQNLFQSEKFYSVFINTLLINLYKLVFQFPIPILLALMINEIRHTVFKRFSQSVTYLPHFLSWVVVSAIFANLLSPTSGIVNAVIGYFGIDPILFMTDERFFRAVLVTSSAFRESGWSSIIYLAAIMAVDSQLYEAARMDGASKLRQIWHITLPGIRSVIVFIIMLRLGAALANDLEQVLMFYSPMVYSVGDVLGTYVYRIGLGQMKYSFSTAVNLFQSVIGLTLVITANAISKKFGERGLW
ncbi:ABC transporter permease [Paenibacillus nasutitermitis]|uniref:Multiple-sugar transport system permease YteP n=1 Tax=Paenibacillus nasutitermitis TaxID=1652958 RepID=A0A917DZY6_9BACL|nr:ABC transporter permease subunit [Paenibacillus nasutitermitis]GGD82938.1 putative multiple-sugar transport system permease YteP [Paenibacillus nasutitermitis]